jgi:co-chaperonin GroES (HSP10)
MISVQLNRVAVVPLENPDKIGSLWIPEIAKERLNQGFVKYIGPDVVDSKVGDYVLFSGYSGQVVSVENEGKLIVLPEDFIVAKLEMGEDELKMIPGIFFKSSIQRDIQFKEVWEATAKVLPGLNDLQMQRIVSEYCALGMRGDKSEPYFEANYELVMEYIARAFAEDTKWRDRIKVVNKKLNAEDYEHTRGHRKDSSVLTSI